MQIQYCTQWRTCSASGLGKVGNQSHSRTGGEPLHAMVSWERQLGRGPTRLAILQTVSPRTNTICSIKRSLLPTGTSQFQGQTSAQRDYLRDLLLATASAAAQGVTAGTSKKSNTAWERWIQFLHSIGLPNDPFLDELDRGQRHRLLCTFAQSLCHCTYSRSTKGYAELVAGTCITAVNGVADAFKATKNYDPRLNSDGKTSFLIQRLYKGYKNPDPSKTQQKSLSLNVIRRMIESVVAHPSLNAFQELVHVAFFFCEAANISRLRAMTPCSEKNSRATMDISGEGWHPY
jgi:hypothetical protein